jgi:hypothetical protein
MPLVRSALIATAACLIGAAAYAQPATGDTSSPPAAGDQSTQQPQTPPTGNPPGPSGTSDMNAGAAASGPAAPSGSTDMSAPPPAGPAPTGAAANTSATVTTDANGVQVIASQPVPDTPANRQAYGKPLSMTGKRTPPIGN